MAEGGGQEAEDRTEAPTPRRLDRAREEGQVPLSREAVGFATLLATTIAASLALPSLGGDLLRAMRVLLSVPAGADAFALARSLLAAAALAVLPIIAAPAVAALLATLAQTGVPRSARPLKPAFSKLNPWSGLTRIFAPEGLVELLRTLLKLAAVGLALWTAMDVSVLGTALMQPAAGLLRDAFGNAYALMHATLLAFGGLAALDLIWTRWRHFRRLRMSRQELREEMKDAEGDPHVKAKRRRIAEQRSRRRMLAAVPKAAVVITNPTHYAIALTYEQGQAGAPRLVAKGVDAMAARIRAVAEEHGVPMVANPPLARALYRLELDTEIPAEHWQAVAEILAYVWRLHHRMASPAAGGGGG